MSIDQVKGTSRAVPAALPGAYLTGHRLSFFLLPHCWCTKEPCLHELHGGTGNDKQP